MKRSLIAFLVLASFGASAHGHNHGGNMGGHSFNGHSFNGGHFGHGRHMEMVIHSLDLAAALST